MTPGHLVNRAALIGACLLLSPSVRADDGLIRADLFMSAGVSDLGKKDYRGAVDSFSQAIEQAPDDAEAYYYRGIAEGVIAEDGNGDYRAVFADWEKAMALDPSLKPKIVPTLADLYLEKAQAYFSQKQWDDAASFYSKVIALKPDDESAFVSRGQARFMSSDYKGALADFTRASEIHPDDYSPYIGAGDAEEKLGRKQLAIDDFTKAIHADPLYSGSYAARGDVEQEMGRLGAAIADWTKALELNPSLESEIRPEIEAAQAKLKAK